MSKSLHEELSAAYDASTSAEPTAEIAQEVVEEVVEKEEPEYAALEPHQEAPEADIHAPEHWASEDKETFKSLDTRGKNFLLKRHKEMEAGFTKKQQLLSEEARFGESFRRTLTPHEAYLKSLNIDPLEAFNKLMSTERVLRTGTKEEKAIMMHNLAKQYEADMSISVDPLQYQNQVTLQKLQEIEQRMRNLDEQKNQEINAVYKSQIESFAGTKTEKGAPKYPHFETVRSDMGLLMSAGKSETLEEAYEQAILLNAALRKEYIASQHRAEVDQNKVAASKKAGFNVKSGSGGTITDPRKELGLRETIRQALEAQNRR
jgi:hypothetical protein